MLSKRYMDFLALKLLNAMFILHINDKMPTIVGILTFMSRIIIMLSSVKYEKSIITAIPACISSLIKIYTVLLFNVSAVIFAKECSGLISGRVLTPSDRQFPGSSLNIHCVVIQYWFNSRKCLNIIEKMLSEKMLTAT